MSEYIPGEGQPGYGTPIEWEEAMRTGEPTGDPFIDGMSDWTDDQLEGFYDRPDKIEL